MIQWINNSTGLFGTDERTFQPLVTSMYGDGADFSTMNDTLKAQQGAIRANVNARDSWNAKLSNVKMSGGRPAPAPYKDWNEFMGPKPMMQIVRDGYFDWEDGTIHPGTVVEVPFLPPLEDRAAGSVIGDGDHHYTPNGVSLTVSDGITGSIIEVCKTIQALCALGMSVEGQATLAYWRQSDVAFRAAVGEGWTAVTGWLGGLFK